MTKRCAPFSSAAATDFARFSGASAAALLIARRDESASLLEWVVLVLGAFALAQDQLVDQGMTARAMAAWADGWASSVIEFLAGCAVKGH